MGVGLVRTAFLLPASSMIASLAIVIRSLLTKALSTVTVKVCSVTLPLEVSTAPPLTPLTDRSSPLLVAVISATKSVSPSARPVSVFWLSFAITVNEVCPMIEMISKVGALTSLRTTETELRASGRRSDRAPNWSVVSAIAIDWPAVNGDTRFTVTTSGLQSVELPPKSTPESSSAL